MNWDIYPNFSESEFKCTHSGLCFMRHEFIDVLQTIRSQFNKPMFISSGYRHESHPLETMKDKPGEHTNGFACDIISHGTDAIKLLNIAMANGIDRIGLNQKGRASNRFIHLGMADKFGADFKAALWTY